MSRGPRILISAGEASGDRLGAGLARALRAARPDVELAGMGGGLMAEAGVDLLQDASEVSVVGFFEVLAHLGAIRGAMARLERAIETWRPDVLVPIDFPDFNLRLAAAAHRAGVPVVYFVSPQVWAWRRGRVRKIRALVRRMLVLFPFELPFYEEAGVPVTFVGHPVAERRPPDADPASLRERLGFPPDATVVGLLPGSRRSEIARLLPVMLDTARVLRTRRPDLGFLVPLAPGLPPELVSEPVARSGLERIRVRAGEFPEVLAACSAGVVASGTASLEAAVAGLPVVVVYRMGGASYLIGRALVRVEHIGLPNLVAGRRVVPELVQSACRPDRIASIVEGWLDEPARAAAVRTALLDVRARLGPPGIFERSAAAVLAETAC